MVIIEQTKHYSGTMKLRENVFLGIQKCRGVFIPRLAIGAQRSWVRGVSCDLKVMGSSCKISHWKQVRSPAIHPSGAALPCTLRMRDALCTGLPFSHLGSSNLS